jgi:hypothetical protein
VATWFISLPDLHHCILSLFISLSVSLTRYICMHFYLFIYFRWCTKALNKTSIISCRWFMLSYEIWGLCIFLSIMLSLLVSPSSYIFIAFLFCFPFPYFSSIFALCLFSFYLASDYAVNMLNLFVLQHLTLLCLMINNVCYWFHGKASYWV